MRKHLLLPPVTFLQTKVGRFRPAIASKRVNQLRNFQINQRKVNGGGKAADGKTIVRRLQRTSRQLFPSPHHPYSALLTACGACAFAGFILLPFFDDGFVRRPWLAVLLSLCLIVPLFFEEIPSAGLYYCPFLLLFDDGFVRPEPGWQFFYCFDTVLSLFEEIPSA